MIVVDSSAWIELFRATQSQTHISLRSLIEKEAELAVTEVVVMELLGGAGDRKDVVRKTLLAYPLLTLRGLRDFEAAAGLFRLCRNHGETLRHGYTDCLIAVPALRQGATVLHHDEDFAVIARHTDLQLFEPSI